MTGRRTIESWLRLVPVQSSASELLDSADVDPGLVRQNLRDIAAANRWLGAQRAMVRFVQAWVRRLPDDYTPSVLDVAAGNAETAVVLRRWSARQRRSMTVLACDINPAVIQVAREETCGTAVQLVRCDALALPFADASVDLVLCSQTLHHFARSAVRRLVCELGRVARLGVLISDLRRSYAAYWGARLLAYGAASPLSRHDGPLSVLRAYTASELKSLVRSPGASVTVRRASGWRVEIVLAKAGV